MNLQKFSGVVCRSHPYFRRKKQSFLEVSLIIKEQASSKSSAQHKHDADRSKGEGAQLRGESCKTNQRGFCITEKAMRYKRRRRNSVRKVDRGPDGSKEKDLRKRSRKSRSRREKGIHR